jgi:dTDP-4-dehydrorhamnose 3,5-epimerase
MRSFDASLFAEVGIDHTTLVQENHSRSTHRVIRGLHVRTQLREAKLVRVVRGAVFDVVVDLRPGSPTFLQWRGFVLDDVAHQQVLVPAGCAHGFQALSDVVDVCYKVDAAYDQELDLSIAWDDPEIRVDWPLADPVLSARDRQAPPLADVLPHLSTWFGAAHVG